MVKSTFLTLFICILHFFPNWAWASAPAFPNTCIVTENDVCNAPPPDSFRITAIGSTFVSLAWNYVPQSNGYRVDVFTENTPNNWDLQYSIAVANPNTLNCSAPNLDPSKKHRIEIRSICQDGTPGELYSLVFPPFTLIIDLVLEGRPPINPALHSCEGLPDPENSSSWRGFRVRKLTGGTMKLVNYFEFRKPPTGSESKGIIMRVTNNHPLVAANEDFEYPISPLNPIQNNSLTFWVGEILLNGSFVSIGRVDLTVHDHSVDLCPQSDLLANTNYIFEPLVGTASPFQGNASDSRTAPLDDSESSIRVQNPFNDYLNIFLPERIGWTKISLFDLNGNLILNEQVESVESQFAIFVGSIPSGAYILSLQSEKTQQHFKVFKSN